LTAFACQIWRSALIDIWKWICNYFYLWSHRSDICQVRALVWSTYFLDYTISVQYWTTLNYRQGLGNSLPILDSWQTRPRTCCDTWSIPCLVLWWSRCSSVRNWSSYWSCRGWGWAWGCFWWGPHGCSCRWMLLSLTRDLVASNTCLGRRNYGVIHGVHERKVVETAGLGEWVLHFGGRFVQLIM
jgi:hypothetical protein